MEEEELPRASVSEKSVVLCDLSGDLLRSTAWWLQPRDRLSLALTCKQLLRETWGSFAERELMAKFPFESSFGFHLTVTLPNSGIMRDDLSLEQCSLHEHLRIVPERSRVQHCYIAVPESGKFVAVLAYDNILRIFDVRSGNLLADRHVGNVLGVGIWDGQRGRQVRPTTGQSQRRSYDEENGLDMEIGFGFSQDSSCLYLSWKDKAVVHDLSEKGSIKDGQAFDVKSARTYIEGDELVGGSCTISPNNATLAWVIFSNSPAQVYISLWDIQSGVCEGATLLSTINARQRNSLGWARIQYSPDGQYIVGVVNTSKKENRTVRRGTEFHNVQLCKFEFNLLHVGCAHEKAGSAGSSTNYTPTTQKSASVQLSVARSHVEWMELDSGTYPSVLASALLRLFAGVKLKSLTSRETGGHERLRAVNQPGLHLNSLHSCPSESLYNTLVFGNSRGWRNNWFVSKHPIYSVHVNNDASRVMVCMLPNRNWICRSSLVDQEVATGLVRVGGPDELTTSVEKGVRNRSFAFKGMPHKQGFASATAFSSNGRWLAGVTLKDDKCIVCVRNVTVKECTGFPL